MNITIDIRDYLSHDEIKNECRYAIRSCVRETFCRNESDINRLISNLGYEFVFKAVSEAIGEDAEKVIVAKVAELVRRDDTIRYQMWRKQDVWEKNESPAIKILYDAIKDNEPLMRERVQQLITDFEFPDVRDAMYNIACDIVSEKLFG